MTVKTTTLKLSTRGDADVHDLTDELADAIRSSGLNTGTLTVFCPSSTSAVTTIEYESGAVNDLKRLFDEIISPRKEYAHNARWHDGNGHSHIRASLLGPSLTIPFVGGELTLGTWQQVIYVDFDNRPRDRQLVVQLIGE
jgi:secondary thiamine-phosphate synthase enzyme